MRSAGLRRSLMLAALGTAVIVGSTGCGIKRSAEQAAAEVSSAGSETVKIGFIVLDTKALAGALGLAFADSGDPTAQINALAADVNSRGGIGGHKMEPVIRVYDAFGDNKLKEEQLCKAFTQDDKVFAVFLQGQFQPNARPCYAQGRTLMLDGTVFPVVQKTFEQLSPYLWQPSFPEYSSFMDSLVRALDSTNWFDGGTTAVMGIDTPDNRDLYEKQVKPAMKEFGVTPVDVRWIDGSSGASLQAGQDQAVLAFKAKNVDRLFVIGGQRLAAYMMQTAKNQQFSPRFAITTWDSPEFDINNYPQAMKGAAGASVQPAQDLVPERDLPFPSGEGETRCIDTLARAGQKFTARQNARSALLYCDAAFLLEQAFRGHRGALTAEAFRDGAQRLGSDFVSAATYSSSFGPGDYAGGNSYRPIVYDEKCKCMALKGETTKVSGK